MKLRDTCFAIAILLPSEVGLADASAAPSAVAMRHAHGGDYFQCIDTMNDAVKTTSHREDAKAWLLLGQCYYMFEAPSRAADAMRRALEIDATLSLDEQDAFDASILVFLEAQRKVLAGRVCEAADDLRELVIHQARVGDAAFAARIFDEVLSLNPSVALSVTDVPSTKARHWLTASRGPTSHPYSKVCDTNRVVVERKTRPTRRSYVVVDSNVKDAHVLVDGKRVGKVGERIEIEPGVSEIEVEHPSYATTTFTIRAAGTEEMKAKVELVPRTAHH